MYTKNLIKMQNKHLFSTFNMMSILLFGKIFYCGIMHAISPTMIFKNGS